jgi:hypothetical protein
MTISPRPTVRSALKPIIPLAWRLRGSKPPPTPHPEPVSQTHLWDEDVAEGVLVTKIIIPLE